MLQTEFIRSLNSNYQRILLDKKPEEKKYQYCMLNRGGIKGLLPCSLRYINGLAYLYYDITSKQNVAQLYEGRVIKRQWMKDFVWGVQQIQMVLSRFLLDSQNILWYPQQVFQDLESNVFSFLYVPYYEEENSFLRLLEFLVEHIDYEDEELVECVYHMYEQYEKCGNVYLQEQIFEDIRLLEKTICPPEGKKEDKQGEKEKLRGEEEEKLLAQNMTGWEGHENVEGEEKKRYEKAEMLKRTKTDKALKKDTKAIDKEMKNNKSDKSRAGREKVGSEAASEKVEKKGIFSRWEGRRKKERENREEYRMAMELPMAGYSVAEEDSYEEEEWGKTIYMEAVSDMVKEPGLYTEKGILLQTIHKPMHTIGKKKDEADVVLEDVSVSRLHARITKEQENYFLEDLNSTNGTFKNGLRMQPYEKRKLEEGDEIRLGKQILFFR